MGNVKGDAEGVGRKGGGGKRIDCGVTKWE